jgi:ketosteroid isomerase-like protein
MYMENQMKEMTQHAHIQACEQRLIDAVKAGDIATLDALLHEDLLFNIPGGITITKAMDMHNYQSGVMQVFELIASDQRIQLLDNTATVVVTVHLKAQYADQAIEGLFRYLRVWKLFGTSWKVIAGSGVQI